MHYVVDQLRDASSCWINDRARVCFGMVLTAADKKINAQVADAEDYDGWIAEHGKPEVCTGKLIMYLSDLNVVQHVRIIDIVDDQECSFYVSAEQAIILATCKVGQKCSGFVGTENLIHVFSAKKL